MGLLLIILFTAMTVSFICSLLESVMLSVSHAYIALLIKKGHAGGRILKKMKKNINHPLAAILTLNTVANVLGAAGVGAQAFVLFGKAWVALVSGIFTVLILVCSEIIPKTLGTVYWKRLAPPVAYVLEVMIIVTFPVVVVLEAISRFIARKSDVSRITRDEIKVLAEIGGKEGILDEKEARIIQNLLLLTEIRARDILTPRAVLVAFQKDRTVDEVIRSEQTRRFSRIPVYGRDPDDITGIVFRIELLEAFYTGEGQKKLETFITPVHAVPESKTIADVLDEFISRREHLFVVIDEYGGTEGIITLEDAVETLLGVEIMDEFDSIADMRKFALERWKRRRKQKRPPS